MLLTDLLPILSRFLEAAGSMRAVRRKQRALAPLVEKLEAAMSAAFLAQGKAFLRRFARFKGKFPRLQEAGDDGGGGETAPDWLYPLFDEAALETIRVFLEPLDEFTAAALVAGAQALIGELKVESSFDLENPRAVEWMQERGAERVTRINDTTRQQIHDIVVKAVDEGWSYDRTAKAIVERFAEFAVKQPQKHIDSRAHLVAVTESAMAYEAGNRIAALDLMAAGLTVEMKWQTVGDSRVSDGCRENQAAGWILADGEFPSGHQHPPRFPGCRCCTLYRRKGVREAGLVEKFNSRQPRDKRGRFAQQRTETELDFTSGKGQRLASAADLRNHYPVGTPGREHTRSRRVYLTAKTKVYIERQHPKDIAWLSRNAAAISGTLRRPEIICGRPEIKPDGKHWSQTFASRIPEMPGKYLVIAVRMANLPGERNSSQHRVTTMFIGGHRNFWSADRSSGKESLKSRWMLTRQQKTDQ